jgi:ATP-dependent Lon protease
MLKNINNDNFLLNFIASNLGINSRKKQDIAGTQQPQRKSQRYPAAHGRRTAIARTERSDRVESAHDIEKQQRDYFLNQQLKTIQEELGQNPQEEEINACCATRPKRNGRKTCASTLTANSINCAA